MKTNKAIFEQPLLRDSLFEQMFSNYKWDLEKVENAGDDLQCIACTSYSDKIQPFYKLTVKHNNILNEIYIYFLCEDCI